MTDLSSFDMGGGGKFTPSASSSDSLLTLSPSEINVAYDSTFGDLSATGEGLFGGAMEYADFLGPVDGFTAINQHGNGVTVSPKDIFNNNDSIPPSTSFTNLTTPGSTFIETPDEDYQTSPLFTDSLDVSGQNGWYSLFPEESAPAPLMARTTSTSSANQIVLHPGGETRKRSSTNASPAGFSPVVKHSSVAGVAARKRDKPLPPILANPDDAVAVKRAKNTAAARKSRAKKVEERDVMEAEIADLKSQVDYWKSIALTGHQPKQEPTDE